MADSREDRIGANRARHGTKVEIKRRTGTFNPDRNRRATGSMNRYRQGGLPAAGDPISYQNNLEKTHANDSHSQQRILGVIGAVILYSVVSNDPEGG